MRKVDREQHVEHRTQIRRMKGCSSRRDAMKVRAFRSLGMWHLCLEFGEIGPTKSLQVQAVWSRASNTRLKSMIAF